MKWFALIWSPTIYTLAKENLSEKSQNKYYYLIGATKVWASLGKTNRQFRNKNGDKEFDLPSK